MTDGLYLVRRGSQVLELRGPYAYPHWGSVATQMSFARAHQAAAAFGGEVVAVQAAATYANVAPKPSRDAETLPPPPFGWSLAG